MKMNKAGPRIFWILALLVVPLWLISYPETTVKHSAWVFFIYSGQLTALTGFVLFALAFVLSARIRWMEDWFGGLDKMYHTHHTMANAASGLLLAHPILLVLRWIPQDIPKVFWYLFPVHRRTSVDLGSWSLWILVVLMIVTIAVRLPYDRWKLTHKFLGVAFVLGILHTFFLDALVTSNPWLFAYLLGLSALGVAGWLYKTVYLEYLAPRNRYRVRHIERPGGNVMEIELEAEDRPFRFIPGQFCFVSFRAPGITREAHPYTLCSVPGEKEAMLMVKALGDYTRNLYQKLEPEAEALLEGPYGRFDYTREEGSQVWIAGGVGIAPFLSWVRNLNRQAGPGVDADLYYCVNTRQEATHLSEFKAAERQYPGCRVHLVCADREGYLDARDIPDIEHKKIFICGPKGMREKLLRELKQLNIPAERIHFEDFDFF